MSNRSKIKIKMATSKERYYSERKMKMGRTGPQEGRGGGSTLLKEDTCIEL
jgi:hypothetical protein